MLRRLLKRNSDGQSNLVHVKKQTKKNKNKTCKIQYQWLGNHSLMYFTNT